MSTVFRELNGSFLFMEMLKRIEVGNSLKDSSIYIGQPPVLEYLCQNGSSTQAELAAALGVSPASMAVSVKRMQKSGLVQRLSDENDRRCNKISITDFGRQELDKVNRAFDEIDRKTYEGFSEDELCQLRSFIERITDNLSKDLPDKKDICKIIRDGLEAKGGES